jgi:large subunit ribosomal protein L28
MASYCEVCGKGKLSGNFISHSHIRTKRKWEPNLQKVKVIVKGSPKRVYVCSRCLRSGKVERTL